MGDTVNRALFYGFALAILLIIVVYFAGVSTEAGPLANAIRSLVYAVTGRNNSGNFAAYPTNNPDVQQPGQQQAAA